MLALQQAAQALGLEADGVRLNWDELAALEQPAVLFLEPNHYVFIDPREPTPAGRSHQLRLYDYPNPARWVTKDELLKTWHGEALLISQDAEHHPWLTFNSILEDFGVAYSKDAPVCTFRMQNTGSKPVKILDVKKSCGCARAELNRAELKPGENALLTVAFDLKGRQGVQRQVVYLRTSDPAQPVIPLTIQGMVLSPVHVSTGDIDLGVVSPGQQVTYDFIVTDRNMGSLKLTTSTFTPEEQGSARAAITVAASWQAVACSSDEELNKRTPGKPEWLTIIRGQGSAYYRVSLDVRILPEVTPGLRQGKLILATNDPHSPVIELPLVCLIAPDGKRAPGRISLGVVRRDQVVTRTIPLKDLGIAGLDLSAGELKLISATGGMLRPRVTLGRNVDKDAVIELQLDPRNLSDDWQGGLHQGVIMLQGPRGTMSIPWMCYAKRS